MWSLTYVFYSEGHKMAAHTQMAICVLDKKAVGGRAQGQRAVTSTYILPASVSKERLLFGIIVPLIIYGNFVKRKKGETSSIGM
jgi:hypothetical protein